MSWIWINGLLSHRRSRVLGVATGVAVAVALLASIGAFLSSTTSKMTERAIAAIDPRRQVTYAELWAQHSLADDEGVVVPFPGVAAASA